MIGLIKDALLAHELSERGMPFKVAFKRARHMRNGHPYEDKESIIDKLHSEKHPHTDDSHICTINIIQCNCGLIYFDAGFEGRRDFKS